ncbi:TPA: hypothetical protein RQN76_002816 [Aeromonas dhakensis]|uniref:hypothetical protein n=1 Tax=Aeromonas dhakensis TaxID=196024 RepID=UPI000463F3EF|nr:hypothetical protein [Aeromonas dhakensis]UNU88896.1 hypothetical protein GB930_12010 [Aeromonas dhakensis]HDX8591980.1 hypothetical protein [Aeromonas dhakensis]
MSDTTEHKQNAESAEADGANHYYSEQYLELQKESVLYEWHIDHTPRAAWSSSLLMGGVFWLIALVTFINGNSHNAWSSLWFFLIFGVISVFYCRYLTDPNQLYHYRMTAKGIYYTQQDKIPEVAYTIMRGIGGLLIVGSIIAVGLVGPLALAGAGAGAFLAFKITNMKPRIRHYGCIFKGSGEISVFGKLCGMEIMEIPYSGGEYALVFSQPEEYQRVLGDITRALPSYKVNEATTRKEFGY